MLNLPPITAAARKLPSPQQDPPPRMSLSDLIARELETADVGGFVQAAKKYRDDHVRELADLKVGSHPLQRRKRAQ